MMTREMLYDAITEVKDELVIEAIEAKPARSRVHWLKFGSIAAAVALVVGLGAGVFSGKIPWLPIGGSSSAGGSGHDEGSTTFMSYAGPVFPLTTVEGGEGLTAERAITYDFQGWMAGNYERPYYGLPVTDSYTLTNPTGEDRDVTLLYPFAGGLYTISRQLPTLTVDGEELETTLLTGQYSQLGSGRSGGLPSMSSPESWAEYQALLSDGRYQAGALGDWPDLSDVPVTVYEITNPWVAEGIKGSNPTIHAGFSLDYSETTPLSYGFNGGSYNREAGTMRQSFSAPTPPAPDSSVDPDFYEQERAEIHTLIVVGEPVSSFQLFGTYDGDPASTDYMKWGHEIGADLRQYETDLESALRAVAERMYDGKNWETRRYDERHWGNTSGADRPNFELYFGMMKDCLLDTGILSEDAEERYDLHWLEELYFAVIERVFYLEAQITVPAGESVTVEAGFLKEASYDFYCASTKNAGVYGYDLVTKLGTNLTFSAQTAKAVNTDGVEIVRQNFGFDWADGVDTVTLDPAEEHYYLEVRRSKA